MSEQAQKTSDLALPAGQPTAAPGEADNAPVPAAGLDRAPPRAQRVKAPAAPSSLRSDPEGDARPRQGSSHPGPPPPAPRRRHEGPPAPRKDLPGDDPLGFDPVPGTVYVAPCLQWNPARFWWWVVTDAGRILASYPTAEEALQVIRAASPAPCRAEHGKGVIVVDVPDVTALRRAFCPGVVDLFIRTEDRKTAVATRQARRERRVRKPRRRPRTKPEAPGPGLGALP